MNYSEIIINGQQIKLIPLGECACGCGEKTTISPYDDNKRGHVKGQHRKYAKSGHWRRGHGATNWKGGKRLHRGYVHILIHGHHRADPNGYVREHIVIAEKALGKPLPAGAVVHHFNERKGDNKTPGNLVICQDNAYHKLLHQRTKALKECGHANWIKCSICKCYDKPEKITTEYHSKPSHEKCRMGEIKKREISPKLKDEQVLEIRILLSLGYYESVIAKTFNVNRSTIGKIRRKELRAGV